MPVIILGSSTESAYLAARLELPYAFASHFAPGMLIDAIKIYRKEFQPSKYLADPYVIVGINAYAADSYEDAKKLRTTQLQTFLDIVTNQRRPLQPSMENGEAVWNNYFREKIMLLIHHTLAQ